MPLRLASDARRAAEVVRARDQSIWLERQEASRLHMEEQYDQQLQEIEGYIETAVTGGQLYIVSRFSLYAEVRMRLQRAGYGVFQRSAAETEISWEALEEQAPSEIADIVLPAEEPKRAATVWDHLE